MPTSGNGGREHYVIVSKIQWKPFWLVTQLYPHNDWARWQNGVNDDVCAQSPFFPLCLTDLCMLALSRSKCHPPNIVVLNYRSIRAHRHSCRKLAQSLDCWTQCHRKREQEEQDNGSLWIDQSVEESVRRIESKTLGSIFQPISRTENHVIDRNEWTLMGCCGWRCHSQLLRVMLATLVAWALWQWQVVGGVT